MISVLYQAPRLKLERYSLRQLKKTGLANQVVVDQETFDKKLEELDGKCLHTVYHWKPSLFERRWNCVWFCGRRSCLP